MNWPLLSGHLLLTIWMPSSVLQLVKIIIVIEWELLRASVEPAPALPLLPLAGLRSCEYGTGALSGDMGIVLRAKRSLLLLLLLIAIAIEVEWLVCALDALAALDSCTCRSSRAALVQQLALLVDAAHVSLALINHSH